MSVDGTRGFGISMSGGVDLDDNDHMDLGIGIMDPGRVVILRSRESIRLKTSSYVSKPAKAVNPEDPGMKLPV